MFRLLNKPHSDKSAQASKPVTLEQMLKAATFSEQRQVGYQLSLCELHRLPHFTQTVADPKTHAHSPALEQMIKILKKSPQLINNPIVQDKLMGVIEHYKHWQDSYATYQFIAKLEPLLTSRLLVKCRPKTLQFLEVLRVEYLTSTADTLKILKKSFPQDLKLQLGYSGALPPRVKNDLNSLRKLIRNFEGSQFADGQTEFKTELLATKASWNKDLRPRLKNIKRFRREFRKATGQTYGHQAKKTTE